VTPASPSDDLADDDPRVGHADGAAYDVDTNTWRSLPASPLAGRFGAVAAWTGSEMLIVGGDSGHVSEQGADLRRDGAAYNPATNTWRTIADAPGCPRIGAWSGNRLVVAGQCASSEDPFVVASYDPASDTWSTIDTPMDDVTQIVPAAHGVVLWSNSARSGWLLFGETGAAIAPIPHDDNAMNSVAASAPNGDLIVFLQLANPESDGVHTHVAHYDERADDWALTAIKPDTLQPMVPASGTGTTADVVAWHSGIRDVSWYDPATGDAGTVDGADAPIENDRYDNTFVAIGPSRFFVWGGRTGGTDKDPTNRPVADGVIFDLAR
jgi:hypothetical protein